jgi:GT2 family glycosyltransferase
MNDSVTPDSTRPIFVVARFRTGSTLLWAMFDKLPGVSAFYEPLHERLPALVEAKPRPQDRHFGISGYFGAYESLTEPLALHRPSFGLSRLYLEAVDPFPELADYLHALVEAAPGRSVLQFNRCDFRIAWLRQQFPDATILHLHRNRHEQWRSTIAGGDQLHAGPESDPFLLTTWARDLCLDLPFLAEAHSPSLYHRFYYLWRLSLLAGSRQADYSIAYEDLLADPTGVWRSTLERCDIDADPDDSAALVIQPTPRSDRQLDPDFDGIEASCDELLARLGLLERFGNAPLGTILTKARSHEPRFDLGSAARWAIRSAHMAGLRLEALAEEKERQIHALSAAANERLQVINRLEEDLKNSVASVRELDRETSGRIAELEDRLERSTTEHGSLRAALETKVAELEQRLEAEVGEVRTRARAEVERLEEQSRAEQARLEAELDELRRRERHRERRTFLGHWIQGGIHRSGLWRLKSGAVKTRDLFSRWRRPKLGVLWQHPPIPMEIPPRYTVATPEPSSGWPTISIATPSFNQGDFLPRTIESVLDQGYPALEYVVQDAASTDGTAQVLERYKSRLTAVESRPDNGQAHGVNLGLAKTSGEIMAYLNADDVLLPGALATVGSYFARNPNVDVVYGHRVLIDDDGLEIGRWVLPPHSHRVLSWADYVPQETLFWRRSLWERVGSQVDESFRFALDWDLILRFREAGARFVRLPRFLGAFRIHQEQKTSAVLHDVGSHEMGRLRERCLGEPTTEAEIHRRVRPYLMRHLVCHYLYRAGVLRY